MKSYVIIVVQYYPYISSSFPCDRIRRRQIADITTHASEDQLAFACYRNKSSVDKIVSLGVSVKRSQFNFLGKYARLERFRRTIHVVQVPTAVYYILTWLYIDCWLSGDSAYGVNLCLHADVQLKSAEANCSDNTDKQNCWLLVFKVSRINCL